jgi:hypothetical protein
MKECDNSTRKIHINNNFILSISLLIMFDTLLLRPALLPVAISSTIAAGSSAGLTISDAVCTILCS